MLLPPFPDISSFSVIPNMGPSQTVENAQEDRVIHVFVVEVVQLVLVWCGDHPQVPVNELEDRQIVSAVRDTIPELGVEQVDKGHPRVFGQQNDYQVLAHTDHRALETGFVVHHPAIHNAERVVFLVHAESLLRVHPPMREVNVYHPISNKVDKQVPKKSSTFEKYPP